MARNNQINLRVSDEEARDFAEAAADADLTVSEWLRQLANYAAGRRIAEHLDAAAAGHRRLVDAGIAEAVDAPKKRKATK